MHNANALAACSTDNYRHALDNNESADTTQRAAAGADADSGGIRK